MKNTLVSTGPEASWRAQLATYDAWLRARGMAEKTRRAYGTDLDQLAEWAAAQGVAPAEATPRLLRRFAGVLSVRGASPSVVRTSRSTCSSRSTTRCAAPR